MTSDLRSRVEVTMHYRVHLHPLDRKKARLKKKTTYTGKLFLEEKYEDCAKFATSTHSATNSTRYRVVEVNERKRESEGEKKVGGNESLREVVSQGESYRLSSLRLTDTIGKEWRSWRSCAVMQMTSALY